MHCWRVSECHRVIRIDVGLPPRSAGQPAATPPPKTPKDFDFWTVETNRGDNTFDLRQAPAQRKKAVPALDPRAYKFLQANDVVILGYYDRDPNRPFIKGHFPAGVAKAKAVIPPFARGLWCLGQANPRLDYLNEQSQNSPDLSASSLEAVALSPYHPGFPPLGCLVFEVPAVGACVCVYWQKLVGSNLQNTLTALKIEGGISVVWETAIGNPFAPPVSLPDIVGGQRLPWLGFDPQYGYLWAIGWGSANERNKIYLLDAQGQEKDSKDVSLRMVQHSIGAGAIVKAWHSRRPPTYREGSDDPNIRAWAVDEGKIKAKWTWDPQQALPGLQIATSCDGQTDVSPRDPLGRWPIDAERRQMVVYVAGSRKLANSNSNTLIQLQYGGGAWGDYQQTDDSRTIEHRWTLACLDIDTGKIKWLRPWIYQPFHQIDYDSCSNQVAVFGDPIPRDYFPASGDTGYAPIITYQGVATQDSLTFSPVNGNNLDIPGCYVTEEPPGSGNYVAHPTITSYPIVPLTGVAWGGGGVWDTPNLIGTFIGPKYDYFAPGHPRLCPLPFEEMERGPLFVWPEDSPDLTRLDPVGGTLCQGSNGEYWHAVAAQSFPAAIGSGVAQLQYQGQSETVIPANPPAAPCPGYTDLRTHWDSWMLPEIVHTYRLDLCRTGPNGESLDVQDISQFTTRPNSSLSWPIKANVYQIVPFSVDGIIVVVRDWHALPLADFDHPDAQPYPVLQIFSATDLSSHLAVIPLFEDLSLYSFEPDPESDPGVFVDRRKWDHYAEPRCLTMGKGSAEPGGGVDPWCVWRHIVRDREANALYCNEVRLKIESGSPVVTRRCTAVGESGRPESVDAIGSLCNALNRSIFTPAIEVSGWPIFFRSNT